MRSPRAAIVRPLPDHDDRSWGYNACDPEVHASVRRRRAGQRNPPGQRSEAGDKQVTVVGGASLIQALLLRRRAVDELEIDIMPVLLWTPRGRQRDDAIVARPNLLRLFSERLVRTAEPHGADARYIQPPLLQLLLIGPQRLLAVP